MTNSFDSSKLIIRAASMKDFDDIMHINRQAFGEEDEADLVAKLIEDPSAKPVGSMISIYEEKSIGHILFTKARIEGHKDILTYLLAPMSVLPEYQNKGVGRRLIGQGHEILVRMGVQVVFVLGHPTYYPKHGFIPDAESHGFPPPYPILPVNADAWMFKALFDGTPKNISGKILCCEGLNKPEYWKE